LILSHTFKVADLAHRVSFGNDLDTTSLKLSAATSCSITSLRYFAGIV
jgi:hypothetical protein